MSETTNTNSLLATNSSKGQNAAPAIVDSFSSASAFKETWQIASALAKSQLIPQNFQGRTEDCVIAIDISRRIGAVSPFLVLQNMYVVYGKPAWSSQFLIACLNICGMFSKLRYKMTGKKGTDDFGCIAWAKDMNDGEILESPEITIGIAKKEGWYTKSGSKWQSMPGLMLRYRAATLFARLYAPELMFGMKTDEEFIDTHPIVTDARPGKFERAPEPAAAAAEKVPEKTDMEKLADLIAEKGITVNAEEVKAFVESKGEMFSFDMVKLNLNRIADAILNENKKLQ